MPGKVHPGVELRNVDGTVNLSPTGEISVPGAGGGAPASFHERLATDVGVAATPADDPSVFPPGQPALVLSAALNLAAETTFLVTASFSGAIQGGEGEATPLGFVFLGVDGVYDPTLVALLGYDGTSNPDGLEGVQLYSNGVVVERLTIPAGAHTVDVFIGVVGGVPDVALAALVGAGGVTVSGVEVEA